MEFFYCPIEYMMLALQVQTDYKNNIYTYLYILTKICRIHQKKKRKENNNNNDNKICINDICILYIFIKLPGVMYFRFSFSTGIILWRIRGHRQPESPKAR